MYGQRYYQFISANFIFTKLFSFRLIGCKMDLSCILFIPHMEDVHTFKKNGHYMMYLTYQLRMWASVASKIHIKINEGYKEMSNDQRKFWPVKMHVY